MTRHSPQLLLPTVILLLFAPASHPMVGAAGEKPMPIALANCDSKCGGIDVPYPFGMKDGCFLKGFQVTCDTSSNPPRVFLALTDTTSQMPGSWSINTATGGRTSLLAAAPSLPIEIFKLSAEASEAWAYGNITSMCSTSSTSRVLNYWRAWLDDKGPFRVSSMRNVVVGVGDPIKPALMNPKKTQVVGAQDESFKLACATNNMGSTSMATDGSCSGWGCCVATLPPNTPLSGFGVSVELENAKHWETSPCSYAMLVESSTPGAASSYSFLKKDLEGHSLSDRYPRGVPYVLEFAVGDTPCPADGQTRTPGYACVSDKSSCASTLNGYICKCDAGYHGNPYVEDGCQDINECEDSKICKEGSICINLPGSHDCPCQSGFKRNDKRGRCEETFPRPAKVAVGFAALVIVLLIVVVAHQLLKLKRLYKQNGGEILEGIQNIRIYTKVQLKKITNNYKNVIGKGQFGQVYKGTDLKEKQQVSQQVAVKKSMKVDKAMKKEFTDEVILQSGMRHKNIVRLLGCCLEMEVPMLVYEFVKNGSLYDILFTKRGDIPVDTRLRIAIGSAEGLTYMHSSAENTIRHGDVKSGNILLDENFTPKISDFGTSKLLPNGKDEKAILVTGDMAYIDPIYMEEGVLTQKSDVYSFGIVLIELITRRAATYDKKRSYVANFVQACLDNGVRNFVDNDITSGEDVKLLEMVSRVAVDCLKADPKERPDMKQVEHQLHIIGQSAQLGQQTNYQGGLSPTPDDVALFKPVE